MMRIQDTLVSKITNFNKFYKSARKSRFECFLTYTICDKAECQGSSILFAVVASKKGVHKRAVKRNRVRRRLKNAFFYCLKNLQIPEGIELQILFMANRNVLEVPWNSLIDKMSQVLTGAFERCHSK